MKVEEAARKTRIWLRYTSIAFMMGAGLLIRAHAAEERGTAPTSSERPNIIVIVADDLGYSDIGAFGGEIRTPNLDRLAKSGTSFTTFYASPFCSPTRAMLMSGTDNHQAGFGDMAELMTPEQRDKPGYEGYLNDRVVAFPQLLRDAGYHTYMVGKWHLGVAEEFSPAKRGFEQSYAMVQGGAGHFDQTGIVAMDPNKPPKALYRENGRSIDIPRQGFYSTINFTDKMVEYIGSNLGDGKPFFAYLAYTAPHWPLQAPDAEIARYLGTYDSGYDAIREKRFAQMKKLGIIPSNYPLFRGNAYWPTWAQLTEEQRRAESKRMAVYAAMVDIMDQQIGRLLDYLEKERQLDNTFVFFMSDNGADGNSVLDVAETRNWVHKDMDNSIQNAGRPNSFIEYGPGWAQVSMTPFRMYKAFQYEGGILVPAFAWGPKLGVGAQVKHDMLRVQDVSATIFELTGTAYPKDGTYAGRPIAPIQGRSFLRYIRGESGPIYGPDDLFGFELGGRKALRKGDWKIVFANKPWGVGEWELFNLAQDRTEQENLAQKYPGKLAEMLDAWKSYVKQNGVLEIEGLAKRPGYSNDGKYYRDLDRSNASAQ